MSFDRAKTSPAGSLVGGEACKDVYLYRCHRWGPSLSHYQLRSAYIHGELEDEICEVPGRSMRLRVAAPQATSVN